MLRSRLSAYLSYGIPALLFGAVSLAPTGAIAGSPCTGAPTNTQTQCLTAVQIPNNPLLSFDISWVNPKRAEMYFADRSNNAVEVIDTETLQWKRRLDGFVGVVRNPNGTVPHHEGSDHKPSAAKGGKVSVQGIYRDDPPQIFIA